MSPLRTNHMTILSCQALSMDRSHSASVFNIANLHDKVEKIAKTMHGRSFR